VARAGPAVVASLVVLPVPALAAAALGKEPGCGVHECPAEKGTVRRALQSGRPFFKGGTTVGILATTSHRPNETHKGKSSFALFCPRS